MSEKNVPKSNDEKILAPNPASLLESEDYKRGWYDGYHEAKKEFQRYNEFPVIPSPPQLNKNFIGCRVCEIDFTNGAWGYVCPRSDCPTKVTC